MEILEFNIEKFEIGNRKEGQVRILCKFCSATRKKKNDKCMAVNIESGRYYCHNCGTTGNIHKFKLSHNGKKQYSHPESPKIALSQHCIEWFKTRNISHDTLKKMNITSGIEFMPQKGKEVNTIHFNYYRDSEIVNIKYRDSEKNFKLFKDAELIFYNLDSIKDSNTVIITEGEIDTLSFIEAGYDAVVSVPNGANIKLDYLDSCIEYFSCKTHIYLATDNDTKGILLRNELVRRLGAERCYKVDFKDCKDANEYLIKYGKEALFLVINEKCKFPVEGIITVNDFSQEIDELYKHGLDPGLRLGWKIDEYIRWETSRLAVITGIPSHGKSEFVDLLAINFALKHNFKTVFFSPENYPLKIHFSKLSEKITGCRLSDLDSKCYKEIKDYLNEYIYFIKPDDENYTLEMIFERAKRLVFANGIKIIVIDPWNRLEHQINGKESETNYISRQLTKMTNFAQNNDVLIILVAHPTKISHEKDDTMTFRVPNLYDISGSAHFYNKTDYGITIYKNTKLSTVDIHIQKVKFRHLGSPGIVNMKYNMNNGRFTEFENDIVIWDNSNWLHNEKINNETPF